MPFIENNLPVWVGERGCNAQPKPGLEGGYGPHHGWDWFVFDYSEEREKELLALGDKASFKIGYDMDGVPCIDVVVHPEFSPSLKKEDKYFALNETRNIILKGILKEFENDQGGDF